MASTLTELSVTRTGRFMQKMLTKQVTAMAGPDADPASVKMMVDAAGGMNLEQMVAMSDGKLPPPLVNVVLASANGRPVALVLGVLRLIPFGIKMLIKRPKAA